jgi:oxygen-independent coproporphyrinogen-3 oxidase
MHARVRSGDLPAPDDDVLAERYRIADAMLGSAGLGWYEISNWAADGAARCRHNEGYWRSANWWGVGPGAHSHVGGVRWWNVLHPRAYAARLANGQSPAAGRERLGATEQRTERIMLELRLAEGLALGDLDATARAAAGEQGALGRLDPAALAGGHAVLTLDGRLLGDAVARALAG